MPKHKGDSTSWPEFRRKWTERVKLLCASGPVDGQILLTQFADAMDPVTKKIIEARRAEDEALTYQQIFAEIDARFSKSARQSSRARLETICLKASYGTRMSMKEFEAFDAEFRLLRSECKEVGDEEARRLYQRALPEFLIESLQRKIMRKEESPTVMLRGLTGATGAEMKTWVDALLGTSVLRVTAEGTGYLVHCRDQPQQVQVLSLNGRVLTTGQLLSASDHEVQLSFEEMRQICRQTLQPRENAHEIKTAAGPPLPPGMPNANLKWLRLRHLGPREPTRVNGRRRTTLMARISLLWRSTQPKAPPRRARARGRGKTKSLRFLLPKSLPRILSPKLSLRYLIQSPIPPLPRLHSPFMSRVMPPRIIHHLERANLDKSNGMVTSMVGEVDEKARGMAMVAMDSKTTPTISNGSPATRIQTRPGNLTTRINNGRPTTTTKIRPGNPTTTRTSNFSPTTTPANHCNLTPIQISHMVSSITLARVRVKVVLTMAREVARTKVRVDPRGVRHNQPGNRGAKRCAGGPCTLLAGLIQPSTSLIVGLVV